MNRPALFVGTATLNGLVGTGHSMSLMAMAAGLHAAGIPLRYHIVDGPNLMVQRDVLARDFLRSDCTHLLCLGGDMVFPPDLWGRLLARDRPLVGIVCPLGPPDLDRAATLRPGRTLEEALALAQEWDVEIDGPNLTVEGGFARVRSLGSGFLLVRRDCLHRLQGSGTVPEYRFDADGSVVTGFFRPGVEEAPSARAEHTLTRRWSALGEDVWAYVDARAGPVREMRYGMPFSRYLQALPRQERASVPA